jgi:hypothetical protein
MNANHGFQIFIFLPIIQKSVQSCPIPPKVLPGMSPIKVLRRVITCWRRVVTGVKSMAVDEFELDDVTAMLLIKSVVTLTLTFPFELEPQGLARLQNLLHFCQINNSLIFISLLRVTGGPFSAIVLFVQASWLKPLTTFDVITCFVEGDWKLKNHQRNFYHQCNNRGKGPNVVEDKSFGANGRGSVVNRMLDGSTYPS